MLLSSKTSILQALGSSEARFVGPFRVMERIGKTGIQT